MESDDAKIAEQSVECQDKDEFPDCTDGTKTKCQDKDELPDDTKTKSQDNDQLPDDTKLEEVDASAAESKRGCCSWTQFNEVEMAKGYCMVGNQ